MYIAITQKQNPRQLKNGEEKEEIMECENKANTRHCLNIKST